MKDSSLRTLLLLYQSSHSPLWFDYTLLQSVVGKISYAGMRSLVSQLKKHDLVHTELFMGKTRIGISDTGRRELEAHFPAFSSRLDTWNGDLTCVVFLHSPDGDKQFRYLRNILLQYKFIQVNRGVYVYPGDMPEPLLAEYRSSYQKSIIAFSINKYIFGDLHGQIIGTHAISQVAETYSGISKELGLMLSLNEGFTGFRDQEKIKFLSVFDRFVENLQQDLGLTKFYFPQVSSAQQLLCRFQHILSKA